MTTENDPLTPEEERVFRRLTPSLSRIWAELDKARKPSPHASLLEERDALRKELASIDVPEIRNFLGGVDIEASHQRKRWGTQHDEGKTAEDWFWLIGWLAGKAVRADTTEKALHHVIATAAACANWHAQLLGQGSMRPGIATPEGEQT